MSCYTAVDVGYICYIMSCLHCSEYLLQDDPLSPEELELKEFKASMQDVQPLSAVVNLCRTIDQVVGVL